jgi:hypothetical protein
MEAAAGAVGQRFHAANRSLGVSLQALRGHSSQPPQPDRYPQYRAVRFSPPELSPGISGRPRRKTDKTAPGRGATRHSVGRSPADEYEAGRWILEVRRGGQR